MKCECCNKYGSLSGIDKCRECRFGYVASHFSCSKENDGFCCRFTNHGFEPKPHDLDELVEGFSVEVCGHGTTRQIVDLRHSALELRYESIKWALSGYCHGMTPDEILKADGHEDWIVKS